MYRESQLNKQSLSLLTRSVIAREKKEREMCRERREREREKKRRMRGERHMIEERETRRVGEMKSEGATSFKTLPCVPSKRPCHIGHGRFEGTHGSFSTVHTEGYFSARQQETHTATTTTTRTPHHNTQQQTTQSASKKDRREMKKERDMRETCEERAR